MDMDTNPIDEKNFQYNGKHYRYHFYLLTVEQAELAREAGEFKYNLMQAEPESFKQVVKSRGAEWLSIVMSYLLREVKNNLVQPFNKDIAESEVEAFVKSLPVSSLKDLRECVSDFFYNIGLASTGSVLLQGEKRQNATEMLLPIIMRSMSGNLSENSY